MKVNLENLILGNSLNPEETRKVVQGLRILARFGDRARRALNAIEQGKEFDEPFPYARFGDYKDTVGDVRLDSCPGVSYCQGVTRKDFPGYNYIKLVLGSLHEGKHGGAKFKEFVVKLKSRVLHVDRENLGSGRCGQLITKSLKNREVILGHARIRKNGIVTFKSSDHYAPTIKIYWDADSGLAEDSVKTFADHATKDLILLGTYDIPAKIVELQQALPTWFIKDYIPGWFREIMSHAKSMSCVETVMDS
jgi:hypothetical protein